MWLLGLAGCTLAGTGEPETSSSSSGTSTSGSEEPETATGGVFTVTSIGEDETIGTPSTTVAEQTTAAEETTTVAETADTSTGESSTSTGEPDLCPGLIADLTSALTAGERCDLLLRVDEKGALLGWYSACGVVPAVDTYSSKTAIEATQCCADGKLIGPGTSPFIFHQLPVGPVPGGVAIISNHLGTVLYEATIGVDAAGTISTPIEWQSPGALGAAADCGGEFVLPMTTYDLMLDAVLDPPPLNMTARKLLANSTAATALPAVLKQVVIDRALVLGYQAKFKGPGASFLLLFELSHP